MSTEPIHIIDTMSTKRNSDEMTSAVHSSSLVQSNCASLQNEETMDAPDLALRVLRKAETAILGRTSQILIVIERCTDDHNYSAIIRTAEALGIQYLWLVDPRNHTQFHNSATVSISGITNNNTTNTDIVMDMDQQEQKDGIVRSTGNINKSVTEHDLNSRREHNWYAKKATKWTSIREFGNTKECIDALREDGRQIWVTDLSQKAVRLTKDDLKYHFDRTSPSWYNKNEDQNRVVIPDRLAIVFGTESVGCTQEMLESSDLRVYLPLRGFADSLNLSVAAALCIQQLFHLCPEAVGNMPEKERRDLRRDWFSKLAVQRILTSGEKKKRGQLISKISTAKNYSEVAFQNEPALRDKVAMIPIWEKELEEIDQTAHKKALASIEQFVTNPPEPLSDMRRADGHRTTFVGKKTRKKNAEEWKDMVATTNYGGKEGATSTEFRNLANDTIIDSTL